MPFKTRLFRWSRICIVSASLLAAVVSALVLLAGTATEEAEPAAGGQPVRWSPEGVLVELTLGIGDEQPRAWNGAISLDRGRVLAIRDLATGAKFDGSAWEKNSQPRRGKGNKKAKGDPAVAAVRLELTLDAPDEAVVEVATDQGDFEFVLGDMAFEAQTFLEGSASAARTHHFTQLTDTADHDDFPATAGDAEGTVWCAYVTYQPGTPIDEQQTAAGRFDSLRTRGNGDQVCLLSWSGEAWSRPVNVTDPGLDVWRPAIVAGPGTSVWVFWAQQRDGNWDLYARRYQPDDGSLGKVLRLTDSAGTDINVVATRSGDGQIWIAWQARRDGNFDIQLARFDGQRLLDRRQMSFSEANDWHPAIGSAAGDVWVAWDTYHKGDYDVYARRLAGGIPGEPIAIATSTRFEARPSLEVDGDGRLWIAYEDADSNWGKDYGPRLRGKGAPFYHERNILVRCLDGGQLHQTSTDPQSPPIITQFDDKLNYQPFFRQRMSMPRLAAGDDGVLWLLYRRHPLPESAGGERWQSFAQSYDGRTWSGEIPLTASDNLLDNRPALAAIPGRGLLVVYSTDGRTNGSRSAQINNLNAALLTASVAEPNIALHAARPEGTAASVAPADPHEADNVRRCRDYRIDAGGKSYRLLRGEFHRHTEISAHRDWDGPLEEVWRYGLDVASMDWIGPGDHDYGVGHEYMWWLTQKQIDLYHAPGEFLSMYTYERSVRYPSGHRNVMFAERGIRPLPHLTGGQQNTFGTAEEGSPDIHNLYKYLKYFDGICSSHTSATNMGTDWRDNDPVAEPVVEIFQGHRQNYEETGAPLAARDEQDSIQGYRPAGFVWEALRKGHRLGFQASSDHVSTHTSYAFVLAEQPTRRAIIDAFRRRHCYAANDNIVMDVRCGEHIMGDEFALDEEPQLAVRLIGTAPIAQVDIVRQIEGQLPTYVYTLAPGEREVEFRWSDNDARPGSVNMYYVRLQQQDGRLAWASPMWIHYQ